MSTSAAYSGLESSPPSSKTRRSSALRSASSSSSASGRRSAAGAAADSSNDDDEGWHHINTGAAHDAPPMKSKTNKMRNANSASSFQIGHDDDNDDDEESDDNDNNDEYDDDDDDDEDDDYTPTLNQHLSGRTTLLRPRSTCRCSLLLQTFLAVGAIFAVIAMIRNGPTMKNNLRRHPNNNPNKSGEMITVVAHAAYEPMHSSRLEEYDAKLTLYRHLATGAEFLAYIPDSKEGTLAGGKSGKSKGKAGGGSDEGGGYDPKPDKVFGVAFRTKPESNTGVPHILEREFSSLVGCSVHAYILNNLCTHFVHDVPLLPSDDLSSFCSHPMPLSNQTRSYADRRNTHPVIPLLIYSRVPYRPS